MYKKAITHIFFSNIYNFFITSRLLFFSFLLCVFFNLKSEERNTNDEIKICKWKNDFNAALSFSFDDPLESQLEISKLFDEYGLKTAFFQNAYATTLYREQYLDILKRGHEIGNHTLSHKNLLTLDSANISYEIFKGKEVLEKAFDYKCLSFASPHHKIDSLGLKIAFANHLFVRNNSPFVNSKRELCSFVSTTNLNTIKSKIKQSLLDSSMLLFVGHGIDSNGYEPITKTFLKEILNYVTEVKESQGIWVSTLKDLALYEYLSNEVSIMQYNANDTFYINLINFDSTKYSIFDSCLISVYIPTFFKHQNVYTSNYENIRSFQNYDILTLDLKKNLKIEYTKKPQLILSPLQKTVSVGTIFTYKATLSNLPTLPYKTFEFDLNLTDTIITFLNIEYDTLLIGLNKIELNNNERLKKIKFDLFEAPTSTVQFNINFFSTDSTEFTPNLKSVKLNSNIEIFSKSESVKINYLFGDINKNGFLDSIDAQLIVDYCVFNKPDILCTNSTWPFWQLKQADINKDSILNAFDAYLILDSLKNIEPNFNEYSNEFYDSSIIKIYHETDTIFFYTKSKLNSFNLYTNDTCFESPIINRQNIVKAYNSINHSFAFASIEPFFDEVFLKIPIKNRERDTLNFEFFENNIFNSSKCIFPPVNSNVPNKKASINLYPNPVLNNLYISTADGANNVSISITNSIGTILYNGIHHESNICISLLQFSKGIYTIVIFNKYGSSIHKIVKI